MGSVNFERVGLQLKLHNCCFFDTHFFSAVDALILHYYLASLQIYEVLLTELFHIQRNSREPVENEWNQKNNLFKIDEVDDAKNAVSHLWCILLSLCRTDTMEVPLTTRHTAHGPCHLNELLVAYCCFHSVLSVAASSLQFVVALLQRLWLVYSAYFCGDEDVE